MESVSALLIFKRMPSRVVLFLEEPFRLCICLNSLPSMRKEILDNPDLACGSEWTKFMNVPAPGCVVFEGNTNF